MPLINCPECNKQISDKAKICVGCGAPVEKERLLKIGNLEVATNDFPSSLNFQDAKKACEALGNGWRLPNKEELNILYENMYEIGGFAESYYWSSTEVDDDIACYQMFTSGSQYSNRKNIALSVRAVRTF